MKPVYDRMTEILYEAESADSRPKPGTAAWARADRKRQEALKDVIAKQTAARKADSGWGPGHEIPEKWQRPKGGVPHTKHVYTGGKKNPLKDK